jgi:hypothetical protein
VKCIEYSDYFSDVQDVTYILDNQTVSIPHRSDVLSVGDYATSFQAPCLASGNHSLWIRATGIAYQLFGDGFIMESSSQIFFTVYVSSPKITMLSPENTTYNGDTGVPLIVNINESTSWMGYSLDGQANITLAENRTLSGPATGLNDGNHNITVYANDTAGNMGKSNVAYFTTETSHETYAPTPSPTQRPTAQPSQTPDRLQVKDFAPMIIPASMIFLAIAVGLLVYFRKRRG